MKKLFSHLMLPMKVALIALFVMSVATAEARDVEQAKQAAMQQMKKHAAKKANRKGGTVVAVDPQLVFSKAKRSNEAYYYVFSAGKDLGYTVVSGDDRLPAIVGYTESGEFDAENMPDGLAAYMEQYQDFVDNATDAQINEVKAFKATAKHAAVAPLMSEKWNQYAPYNNLCPEYTSGKKSVTGCVATAVAQILHHWQCPDKLKADIPAYTTDSRGISMAGISKDFEYDWENMPNVYTGSESDVQNNAVANLMLHIGCAVQMNYGPSSGASASAETFTKYFGMDEQLVQELDRSSYNITQWDNILYKEIAAKRPVYYSGRSTGGGHAFVIHGYDDGLYYVNWGWGGMSDGYFDVTILNPDNTSGAGASSANDGYSMKNSMIIGIQPDNGDVDDVPGPFMGSISQLELKNVKFSGDNMNANVACTPKNVNLNGKIKIGIGYVSGSEYINVCSGVSEVDSEDLKHGYFYTNFSLPISFAYEDGKTYKLCLIESKDGTNWIACAGEESSYITIKIQDGAYTVVDKGAVLSAKSELDSKSGGYAGMSNSINITVTNNGDKEYYDKVYVYVGTGETMPGINTFAAGITAPVDGSTTFNFAYTPESAGTYNFWITDAKGNQIGQTSITFSAATAPALSFESITCSNASNETVYGDYYYDDIQMNKVNDTKAEFVFVIKNDGGYYEGEFYIMEDNSSKGSDLRLMHLAIPSGTTTFKFTSEGNVGDVVEFTIFGRDVSIANLTTPNIHNIKESSSYYPFDNSEICYLGGLPDDTKDLNITYDVADADVARLNAKYGSRTDITSIDLTKAASVKTATKISTGNPNTLIFVNDGATVANGYNVVVKDGEKYTCKTLQLKDAMPFKAPIPFKANYAAYSRTVTKAGYYSIYLPFAVNSFSQGTTVEKFDGVDVDKKEVYLSNVTSMDAYTPYIYKASDKYPMFGEYGVEIAVEPDQTGNTFIGTLDGITAPNLDGYYALKPDGSGFGIATSTAYAEPFRAVIRVDGAKGAPIFKAIHGSEGTTGIDEIGSDAVDGDAYYNLKGEKVLNPTKGIYIKNGKKYIFK